MGDPDRSKLPERTVGLAAERIDRVHHLREAVDAGSRALSRLTLQSEAAFLQDVLGAFASWVVDLPASERNHHSGPFGLWEHSLEVALETLQDLERRWGEGGGGGALAREERSVWSRVAYTLALLHDCGKMLDIEVLPPEGVTGWNPLKEPLAAYKARVGLPVLERTPHRFKAGRGMHGHEGKGGLLIPVILAGTAGSRLQPLLEPAWTAYECRHLSQVRSFPIPLAYLADRVHHADRRSVQKEWRGKLGPLVKRSFRISLPPKEGS